MINKLKLPCRIRLFLLFLLPLISHPILLSAHKALETENVSRMYITGLHLIGNENYSEAIAQFKNIIAQHPYYPKAYAKLVEVYKKIDGLEKANQYFRDLMAQNTENALAYYGMGLVLKEYKDFRSAIENYQKSIRIFPQNALTFKDIVDAYKELNILDEVIGYIQSIIVSDSTNAEAHYGLAYVYELQESKDDWLKSVNTAIRLKPDLMAAHYSKTSFYEAISNYNECLKSSKIGLELAEKCNNLEYMTLFYNLMGIVYRNIGEPHNALEYYQRALKIDKQIGNKKGEGIRVGNIGKVYYSLSDFPKAIENLRIALKIAKEMNDYKNQASILNAIGASYRKLGKLEESLEYYKQGLKVANKIDSKKYEGIILGNIGIVYKNLGNLTKALTYYEQALKLSREIGKKRSESIKLGNIGIIYKNLGDYDKALENYRSALKIDREISNRGSEAIQLSSIGDVHFIQGNYSLARKFFEQSLVIATEIEDKSKQAFAINHLGEICIEMKDYSRARKYYGRALTIYKEIRSKEKEAFAWIGLGKVELGLDNYSNAIEYQKNALFIGEQIKSPTIIYEAHSRLALAFEKQEEYQKSLHHYQLAIEETEKVRGVLQTEKFKTGFFERKIEAYERLIHLLAILHEQQPLAGYDRQSFHYVEKAKARTFLDILAEARADVRTGIDLEIKQKEADIFKNISSVQIQLQRSDVSDNDWIKLTAELKQLEYEQQTLEREIRRSHGRYASLIYPEPYNLDQVKEHILDNVTVLVEYLLGDVSSFAWVVTRKNTYLHKLPGRHEIESDVEEYLKTITKPVSLTNPLHRHYSVGDKLYHKLLAPLVDYFGDKKNIIIVPDGILHYLPFETLVIQKANDNDQVRYLVQDFCISYAPSSSVLCYINEEKGGIQKKPMQLLALGDPYFDNISKTSNTRAENEPTDEESLATDIDLNEEQIIMRGLYERRGFQFNRLPYSGLEVTEISELFPADERVVYLREQAKEEVIKQEQLDKFKYIHFATHGLIEKECTSRSGIVFTLDDDPHEDGILQMNEILNLKMDADLTVLSACQTGLGTLRKGEGIVGLTRAVMYAGTPSIVVSLWNINDRSTAIFMKSFYTYLIQGNDKSEALHLAKLDMLQSERPLYSHPFFWAPFILIGDPE